MHTRACGDSSSRARARACSRGRCTPAAHDLANAIAKGREDGEVEEEEGRRVGGGKGVTRRTRAHTGCTGVNYASREMSNCSPYRKIYNSALCGKHYVLPVLPPSALAPVVPPLASHTVSPPVCVPSSTLASLRLPHVPILIPPRCTRARQSRFANKFARRTATVLTSSVLGAPLPEIHFSATHDAAVSRSLRMRDRTAAI